MSMSRNVLLLLIACNLIWSANPLMGKLLLQGGSGQGMNGIQVAWVRYFLAFLAFLVVAVAGVIFKGRRIRSFFILPTHFTTWMELAVVGMAPFVFAPILQFVGLESAQAMDNSFMVATEPLITILLAWGILGERMTRAQAIGMGLALVGFFFFSGAFGGAATRGFSIGILLLLLAQVGEAGYSVFGRKLVQRHSPIAVLGSALTIGAFVLTLFVFFFDHFPSPPPLDRSEAYLAALWLGPIGSTLAYFLWVKVSKSVAVPAMAMTLFIQSIAGAVLGYLFLDEFLTLKEAFGALLILLAVAYCAVGDSGGDDAEGEKTSLVGKEDLRS
jgi:drug/metabolite transporter (DMT)-like permease